MSYQDVKKSGSFASLNTITQDYLKCYNKNAFFFIFFHFLLLKPPLYACKVLIG